MTKFTFDRSPQTAAADEPEKLLLSSTAAVTSSSGGNCRSSGAADAVSEPGAPADSHGSQVHGNSNSCKRLLTISSSPLADQFPSCRVLQPATGSGNGSGGGGDSGGVDHPPPYQHRQPLTNQTAPLFAKQATTIETAGTVAPYSSVQWSSSFDHGGSTAASMLANGKIINSSVHQPSLGRSDVLDFDYSPVCSSAMYGTANMGNSYADCVSPKGLIQNNMLQPFTTPYYNSAVYGGQCLPNYAVQTAGCAFYGNAAAQPYSVTSLQQPYAGRNVKSSPYPSLNAYFGTASGALSATAPCCATAYASTLSSNGLITVPNVASQNLDCTSYPSASYPHGYSQYYGGLTYNSYGQISSSVPAVTTTVTYQLSQLPPCTTVAANLSTTVEDPFLGDFSSCEKSESKKNKSKKRKVNNPSFCIESDFERVFIWDLDETCIQFNSLLDGSYATKCGKDVNSSVTIGLLMEELILFLSDTHFLFSDMEDCDQVHISDVINEESTQEMINFNILNEGLPISTNGTSNPSLSGGSTRGGLDYMRKISCKYHRIRELYNRYKENVTGLLACGKQEQWRQLRSDIDSFTDSWHALVLKCVSVIASRSRYANVVIASSSLIPAYSKLLLYGLAPFFPVENIYSSLKIGKEATLQRVLNKYGKKCTYVVVGDGHEDELAAKQLQFPLWRVTVHSDLVALHHALDLGHL